MVAFLQQAPPSESVVDLFDRYGVVRDDLPVFLSQITRQISESVDPVPVIRRFPLAPFNHEVKEILRTPAVPGGSHKHCSFERYQPVPAFTSQKWSNDSLRDLDGLAAADYLSDVVVMTPGVRQRLKVSQAIQRNVLYQMSPQIYEQLSSSIYFSTSFVLILIIVGFFGISLCFLGIFDIVILMIHGPRDLVFATISRGEEAQVSLSAQIFNGRAPAQERYGGGFGKSKWNKIESSSSSLVVNGWGGLLVVHHTAHGFPDDTVFIRLLAASAQYPKSEAIVHEKNGLEKTYPELLSDIVHTRDLLREQLSGFDQQGLLRDHRVYIAVVSCSVYEFIIAFFAVRAIGGISVILPSGIRPAEANLMLKVRPACILAGNGSLDTAAAICSIIKNENESHHIFPVLISSRAKPLGEAIQLKINYALRIDSKRPGAVLFTSGTSGPPKGVVLPRASFHFGRNLAEPGSATLGYKGVHWWTGCRKALEPVLSGKKLYHIGETASAREILEALGTYHITTVGFIPAVLHDMKEYILANPPVESWSSCFKGLSAMYCGGATLEQSKFQFWTELTGLPFYIVYGANELGGRAIGGMSDKELKAHASHRKGSIGRAVSDTVIKLSEGDHGEILAKSPRMLLGYFGDDELTEAAFDDEGYYKTGDLAELKDGQYWFRGRASSDYIRFRQLRISILAVESSLLKLPYISEACVLAIPHREARQLCGAAVRFQKGSFAEPGAPTVLARIRADLAVSLAPFMLPTVLAVLGEGQQLPRTHSGKVMKRDVLRDCFGVAEWFSAETMASGVEFWGSDLPHVDEAGAKLWDRGGMQASS
ncbi:acetyl synthetase [Fusarium subglutinans]|uniref:Acetyl synthetase n=1 Tax=Gibberella subglutinans TaxID=42677 RepID=A0A8H5V6Z9_GIBSU|nr:acetyl synthetase [Fusarium subglutinans]KAF5611523.1 acetyl synthetase [Fusarium subglutinans]